MALDFDELDALVNTIPEEKDTTVGTGKTGQITAVEIKQTASGDNRLALTIDVDNQGLAFDGFLLTGKGLPIMFNQLKRLGITRNENEGMKSFLSRVIKELKGKHVTFDIVENAQGYQNVKKMAPAPEVIEVEEDDDDLFPFE